MEDTEFQVGDVVRALKTISFSDGTEHILNQEYMITLETLSYYQVYKKCYQLINRPAIQCDLNPVIKGSYGWGDMTNTMVELRDDGTAIIIQGDQKIKLDCFGFFKDVVKVFDLAINAMPENETKTALWYKGLGTSRSLPVSGRSIVDL